MGANLNTIQTGKITTRLISKIILKNDIFIIVAFYCFAYGLILLNQGIFWDDWCLYGVDNENIMQLFEEQGRIWGGYFHVFLLSLKNNVAFYRILIFSSYLLPPLFLDSILKTVKGINNADRLVIILFFVLFPANFARITLITAMYALGYCIFFAGFWLISEYAKSKKNIYRIISIPLFMLSFDVNSLLLYFFFTVVVFVLYFERKNLKSLKLLPGICLKYLELPFLPLAFWGIKKTFFATYGFYNDYNIVSLSHITWNGIIDSFRYSFSYTFKLIFLLLSDHVLLTFVFGFLLFLFLRKRLLVSKKSKGDFAFAIYGLVLFFIGVVPYLLVGKMPSIHDWANRHQLLVSLGAAFVTTYSLKIFFNELKIQNEIRVFTYSLIVVLFIAINFTFYLNYQKDWYKRCSMIEHFKESEVIRSNSTFLFKDNAPDLSANARIYRFYEYAGLMKYAFGEETRFGVEVGQFRGKSMEDFEKFFISRYNMKDYKQKEPEYEIIIEYGSCHMSNKKTLSLLLDSFVNQEKFQKDIKEIVRLEPVKL